MLLFILMSRSFKKVPGYKDRNPWYKRHANRIVRRRQNWRKIGSGKDYKKLVCSYDICDWSWFYFTDKEIIKHAMSMSHDPIRYISRMYSK